MPNLAGKPRSVLAKSSPRCATELPVPAQEVASPLPSFLLLPLASYTTVCKSIWRAKKGAGSPKLTIVVSVTEPKLLMKMLHVTLTGGPGSQQEASDGLGWQERGKGAHAEADQHVLLCEAGALPNLRPLCGQGACRAKPMKGCILRLEPGKVT